MFLINTSFPVEGRYSQSERAEQMDTTIKLGRMTPLFPRRRSGERGVFTVSCLHLQTRLPSPMAIELRPPPGIFSLSPRGTSGERAGERGFPFRLVALVASKTALLSPALSSLGGMRGRMLACFLQFHIPNSLAVLPSSLPARASRGEGVGERSVVLLLRWALGRAGDFCRSATI